MTRRYLWFRRWLVVGVLVVVLVTGTAAADGGGSLLGPFDLVDSRGIRLSQYQMSLDDGTGLTKLSLAKSQFFWVISLLWSGYVAFIGISAWLLDWTVGLTWVGWIAGPVSAIEQTLRNNLLAPIGANQWGGAALGLLTTLGGAIGAWRVRRGGASGWVDMAWSAVAAMLAVTVFAAPVVMVAGDGTSLAAPLRTAQQAGISLSQMITTGNAPTATIGGTVLVERDGGKVKVSAGAGDSTVSKMLVDAFVRPVHQQLNFGEVLDETDPNCAARYDQLLKAGPYDDGSAKDIRKGMGECNKKYLTFADAGASANWVFGFSPYMLGVVLLGLLLLTFAVLMWTSVVALLWSSLSLMFNTLLAVLPGPARTGFLRDLASVAANLVYVVINMVVISVVVKLIEWGFTSVGGPLGVKFIAVDILLMAGIVVLVWSKIRHSKGERSLLKSMTHAITGRDPVPTRVDRGSRWVSGTTQAAAGRSISGAGRKMRKAVTSRPAAAAATVAAGALTGGAGAGAVAKTMKAARVAAAVSDTRQGNPTVGSSITGGAAVVARRAHDHLAAKVDATKAVHRHHRDASGPARATTGHRHLDSAAKLTGSVQRRLDQVNTAWTAPLIKAEHAATAPLKKAAAPIKKLTHPTPDPAPRRAPRVPKPAAHARATTNPATPLTAVTSPAAISPAARPAATPTPGAVRVTSSSNRPPANKAVARPPVPEPAHPRGGTAPTARPASKTAGERKPTKNQPAPTAATSAAPRSRPTRKPLPSPARGPA